MNKYIFAAFIVLATLCAFSIKSCNNLQNELEHKEAYISDYEQVITNKNGEIKQLQMTTDELKHSKDSLNKELIKTIKELDIKPKNVKEYIYIKDKIHDTISIIVPDSIFVNNFDTSIVLNEFTKFDIKIDAPYQLNITPDIVSEKLIVFSYKKEYVNERSKIFFIRWFQKKRKVVVVDIKESNNLIKTTENRFVNIID